MHCQWLLGQLERERVGGVGLWVMGGETGLMGNRARLIGLWAVLDGAKSIRFWAVVLSQFDLGFEKKKKLNWGRKRESFIERERERERERCMNVKWMLIIF